MIDPADRGRAAVKLLFGGFLVLFWAWLGLSLLMLQGFYWEHTHGDPRAVWVFGVMWAFVAVGSLGVVAGTRWGWRTYRLLTRCLPADARPVKERKRVLGDELTVWSFRFTALDGREHAVYAQGLYRNSRRQESRFEKLHREGGTELVLYRRDDPDRALLAADLPHGFSIHGRTVVDVVSSVPVPLYLVPPLAAVGINGWIFLSRVGPVLLGAGSGP